MPRLTPITCCLVIIFTMFIDKGNGKWKSKNRENLQKDIAKFQEMAEKIEDEIEDIYDEYSDNWDKNEYISNDEDASEISDTHDVNINNDKNNINILNIISNSTKNIIEGERTTAPQETFKENVTPKVDTMKISTTEKANIDSSKWPKFEDILLDIGKKYDWKNDRWIKVKKKTNQSTEESHLAFQRHFSYRTVKLNRSKSRRNVVIAVTAVR